MKFLFLLTFVLLFQSCSKGYGNKLTAKNLNVYFESKDQEEKANSLGKYWQSKGLVGEREQNIKLSQSNDTYYVHLILSNEFKDQELTFNERKLLLDLQKELDSTIFKGEDGCQILICDNEFKPIFNINK